MSRGRSRALASILVVTPLGLYTKFYDGIGAEWVNSSLGGVFYEIFWCLVVFIAFDAAGPAIVAGFVFLATSFLEVLQLWHPPVLEWVRSTFLGAAMFGTSFDAWDFLYYSIGCGIGWGWLALLRRGAGAGGDFELEKGTPK